MFTIVKGLKSYIFHNSSAPVVGEVDDKKAPY